MEKHSTLIPYIKLNIHFARDEQRLLNLKFYIIARIPIDARARRSERERNKTSNEAHWIIHITSFNNSIFYLFLSSLTSPCGREIGKGWQLFFGVGNGNWKSTIKAFIKISKQHFPNFTTIKAVIPAWPITSLQYIDRMAIFAHKIAIKSCDCLIFAQRFASGWI